MGHPSRRWGLWETLGFSCRRSFVLRPLRSAFREQAKRESRRGVGTHVSKARRGAPAYSQLLGNSLRDPTKCWQNLVVDNICLSRDDFLTIGGTSVSIFPSYSVPGYQFEVVPDLSRLETRERLSQSAVDGFFAIVDRWKVSTKRAGELLGGVPRSTVYKLRTVAGTLTQDQLTRISYIVGIYKALYILLPDESANRWMTEPNDHFLFHGQSPLEFVVRRGIPGLQQVRSFLDAARGGK
jgi:uncharacterized protein (DUF2384 family)